MTTAAEPARADAPAPKVSPSELSTGEVILDRFEIRCFLGQGGMGQVFEAFDRELGEAVALKVLRPEIAREPRAVAAFKREVQLARRVTHPNVCRIFDLFQHQREPRADDAVAPRPLLFLTMELVRGETLGERLRLGGPLAVGEALLLARQLAAALDAAHAAGVLHRDLKSGNVMLAGGESRPRLVVTDFGLARPAGALRDAGEAAEGGPSGTPAYMAPELLLGGASAVASDLYAFGVVLFELLTGQLPFGQRPGLVRSESELAAPSRLRPDLHPAWDRTVVGCLRFEPGERFASAGAAVAALRSCDDTHGPETETLSPFTDTRSVRPGRRWPRRAQLAAALGAILLVGAIAGVFAVRRDPPGVATRTERDRIVLGHFENLTGEPVLDGTLESALRIALEQSPALSVLSESQIQAVLVRMERDPSAALDRAVAAEIGVREGTKAVVLGSVAKLGESYLVSATVVDPQTGSNLFSTSVGAARQELLLPALGEVARAVRGGLGETSRAIAESSTPLEKVTTANLEALRLYSLAARRLDNFRPDEAMAPLRRALELDPEFAMAHARLASGYRMLGRPHGEEYHHLRRALELRDRLSDFEQVYVESWVATLEASPETVALWTLAHLRYPDEPVAVFNLGAVHFLYTLRYDLCAEVLGRIGEQPDDPREIAGLDRLGYCLLALGRTEEAQAVFERFRRIASHLTPGPGYGMLAAGRYDASRALFERGLEHPSARRRFAAQLGLAILAADQGRLDEALMVASRAHQLAQASDLGAMITISADLSRLALVEQLASAREQPQVLAGALATMRLLLADRETPPGSYPVVELALLGRALARAGQLGPAEAIFAELEPRAERSGFASHKVYTALLEAELHAARGDYAEAVKLAERSLGVAETFQTHAALARWHLASGELEKARHEAAWLADHRGAMFGEVATEDALGLLDVLDARAVRAELERVGE